MNRYVLAGVGLMALLVTGCPQNEYEVELTPEGMAMERKLTFYCADGTNTGGTNYQPFAKDELSAIVKLYPAGAVTHQGDLHVATGKFTGKMPPDVGGSGSYTNVRTSLGSAGFYLERFRGNDDAAGQAERRLKAADRMTDLVIGWSRMEFRNERRYDELHHFLDVDFRRDLKNATFYWMLWQVASAQDAKNVNGGEEMAERFAGYLIEHGYLREGDLPELSRVVQGGFPNGASRLIQRLLAEKLGWREGQPMPKSLAFVADFEALEKSWDRYLMTTETYRAQLSAWRRKNLVSSARLKLSEFLRQTNSVAATAKLTPKPEPSLVDKPVIEEMIQLSLDTPDHLVVRLRLAEAPLESNGKWDAAKQTLTWESHLESRTNLASWPVFCYANWVEADDAFQRAHFGKAVLGGTELLEYCLWRVGLDAKQSTEWEAMVAGLKPEGWKEKLDGFQFSDEAAQAATGTNAAAGNGLSDSGKAFFEAAGK